MAITKSKAMDTTSSNYKVRVGVEVTGNVATNKECTVKVVPYLQAQSQTVRMQHNWHIRFLMDGKVIATKSYTGTGKNALPNDTAQKGVVSAGKLTMKKGVDYQWGDAYTFKNIKLDGKKHTFGVRLECIGTTPRYCPSQTGYVSMTVSFVTPTVTPTTPTNVQHSFNEATRTLTYSWDAVDTTKCAYIQIERSWYDENLNLIGDKNGFVGTDGKISNTAASYEEIIAEGVAQIQYKVYTVSTTNTSANSDLMVVDLPTNDKVWVQVNGTWIKAIPWVKVDDKWKKANKSYVKTADGWKRTTM